MLPHNPHALDDPLPTGALAHDILIDRGLAAQAPRAALERPSGGAVEEAGDERLRVLVVEDDPAILEALVDAVASLGHWATGVGSAEAASIRYLDGAFDVLLTDVGLPGLSGRDLAQRLKIRSSGLHVIYASGCARPSSLEPGTAWLDKPCSLDAIGQALAVVRKVAR